MENATRNQNEKRSGQISLFNMTEVDKKSIEPDSFGDVEEWPQETIFKFEKEILGHYISGHPLSKYQFYIKKYCTIDSKSLEYAADGANVKIIGILHEKIERVNNDGKRWAILNFDDLKGSFCAYIFSEIFMDGGEDLEEFIPYYINGKVDKRYREPKIIINKIERFVDKQSKLQSEIHIMLIDQEGMFKQLDLMKNDFVNNIGKYKLFFHIKDENGNESIIKVNSGLKIDGDEQFITHMKDSYPTISKIWVE
jgi:DNA polymerase-3 subunit alpha